MINSVPWRPARAQPGVISMQIEVLRA